MRIVFMGTPEFAVPSLQRLVSTPGIEVAGVVCQPDRPAGRKGELRAPEVKTAALGLGLEVYQPEAVRTPEALAWLAERTPEALVVVAFGQLLPRRVFELPPQGAINAHGSLLPKYRGAAPIQWAVANGETKTGITTMQIDAGLDTGAMLLQREVAIGADETAEQLRVSLAEVAAELLVETLLRPVKATPQAEGATHAPPLKKEDGRVDWSLPAATIYNHWRGFQPWPGLWTRWQGQRLAIVECRPADEPGTGLTVACGDGGWLRLVRVQLEGRKPVRGDEFARGVRLEATVLDPRVTLS